MLTIHVPPELAIPLAEEAGRRGTTPELLALEGVRRVLPPSTTAQPAAGTLLDFLSGYVGTVEGSSEPFSQDCGRRFAEGLSSGQPARP
jgi:hypothetical protein